MDKRLYALGGLVAAGSFGAWISAERLRRRHREQRRALLEKVRSPGGGPIAEAELEALPAPVRRYLLAAGVLGRRRVTSARVVQGGSVRRATGGIWRDLRAEAVYTVAPPSLLWQAKVQVGLAALEARETLLSGEGCAEVHAGPGLTLSRRRGAQVDRAASLRWLADAPLLPTALTPPGPVTWAPVGKDAARATLGLGDQAVSGTFLFGAEGLPVAFEAERYRPVPGGHQLVPWVVRYLAWGRREGFLVPIRTEASWILEPGALSHARAEVDEVFYERSTALPATG